MSLGAILLIILVPLLIGAWPRWPRSTNGGHDPSGGPGLVPVSVIIPLLLGRI